MMRAPFDLLYLPLIVVMLSACAGIDQAAMTSTPVEASTDLDRAREALIEYFEALSTSDYQTGSQMYAGDLKILIDWNADIAASDPLALFEAACTRQLNCLPVREVVQATQIDASTFEFRVEFSNPDDSLFVLGPCCGATETEMPPVSQFDCGVEKNLSGEFQVLCLPIYSP